MARADHGHLEGGFLYVMSNESMEGYYKVGQTTDLERRRLELSRATSCPKPFVCLYAVFTKDYIRLEKTIHKKLERFRIPGKEFFTCTFDVILREIQKTYEEEISSNICAQTATRLKVESSESKVPLQLTFESTKSHDALQRLKTKEALENSSQKDFNQTLFESKKFNRWLSRVFIKTKNNLYLDLYLQIKKDNFKLDREKFLKKEGLPWKKGKVKQQTSQEVLDQFLKLYQTTEEKWLAKKSEISRARFLM